MSALQMNVSTPADLLKRGVQDLAVKYKIETSSAVKAAVILVIVLTWRDVLERGAKWLSARVEERWHSPVAGALIAAGLVTLIGVVIVYMLSRD